ncbi:MAG TPA: hypothetical protein VHM19_06205 [Polyangiales bacterium]|jgi:hypothetical protein|nr:hypothetical protein [Polyangiales bacterium]
MHSNNTAAEDRICKIQSALLDMPVGTTGSRFGVVVTRYAKDAFEVGTWGRTAGVGSETAAEQILAAQVKS